MWLDGSIQRALPLSVFLGTANVNRSSQILQYAILTHSKHGLSITTLGIAEFSKPDEFWNRWNWRFLSTWCFSLHFGNYRVLQSDKLCRRKFYQLCEVRAHKLVMYKCETAVQSLWQYGPEMRDLQPNWPLCTRKLVFWSIHMASGRCAVHMCSSHHIDTSLYHAWTTDFLICWEGDQRLLVCFLCMTRPAVGK